MISLPRHLFLEVLATLRAFAALVAGLNQHKEIHANVTYLCNTLENIYNRS